MQLQQISLTGPQTQKSLVLHKQANCAISDCFVNGNVCLDAADLCCRQQHAKNEALLPLLASMSTTPKWYISAFSFSFTQMHQKSAACKDCPSFIMAAAGGLQKSNANISSGRTMSFVLRRHS